METVKKKKKRGDEGHEGKWRMWVHPEIVKERVKMITDVDFSSRSPHSPEPFFKKSSRGMQEEERGPTRSEEEKKERRGIKQKEKKRERKEAACVFCCGAFPVPMG